MAIEYSMIYKNLISYLREENPDLEILSSSTDHILLHARITGGGYSFLIEDKILSVRIQWTFESAAHGKHGIVWKFGKKKSPTVIGDIIFSEIKQYLTNTFPDIHKELKSLGLKDSEINWRHYVIYD